MEKNDLFRRVTELESLLDVAVKNLKAIKNDLGQSIVTILRVQETILRVHTNLLEYENKELKEIFMTKILQLASSINWKNLLVAQLLNREYFDNFMEMEAPDEDLLQKLRGLYKEADEETRAEVYRLAKVSVFGSLSVKDIEVRAI